MQGCCSLVYKAQKQAACRDIYCSLVYKAKKQGECRDTDAETSMTQNHTPIPYITAISYSVNQGECRDTDAETSMTLRTTPQFHTSQQSPTQ